MPQDEEPAGRGAASVGGARQTPERQRLQELQELHSAGLLDDSVFERRQEATVEYFQQLQAPSAPAAYGESAVAERSQRCQL